MIRIKLPRVRHQMWNGKWRAATLRMRHIYQGTDGAVGTERPVDIDRMQRFRQHLLGLRISSSPAKSGMSHLVNQRMGKRQPMCWSSKGAHLLLQVRCAVLDDRLESLFREWHPQFRRMPAASELPAI